MGALVGAPVLDLKNRGCLAPMAPTLKRPLKCGFSALFSQFFQYGLRSLPYVKAVTQSFA